MPRIILNPEHPDGAPLPYRQWGEVLEQGNALADGTLPVACSVWPASGQVRSTGKTYDHVGEADFFAFGDLSGVNRKLRVEDEIYAIIDIVQHRDIPHCALQLRRVRAGGGG